MEKEILKEPNYVKELVQIIRSGLTKDELMEHLSNYHENDIAGALEQLTPEERKRLYPVLGTELVSEIFTYIEDPDEYLMEIPLESAAKVISHMDYDDAVDILEEMDDSTQEKLVQLMDDQSSKDVQLIFSYDDDEIGSTITTNYVVIKNNLTIRQAMHALVRQAGEHDNISTIYVVDDEEKFYGAIDLKDLIIAREGDSLMDIVSTSYPYVHDH